MTALLTQDYIDQVEARVKLLLPGIEVSRYPGRPQDYRLTHPQGAVLISYLQGQAGDPIPSRGQIWLRQVLSLLMCNRSLWESDGMLDHLDRLRTGLHQWMPTGAKPLQFLRERLLQAEAGIWWYGADYELTRPLAC